MISEGAEARIYEAKTFGIPSVIKDRAKKGYRIASLDELIRVTRTKSEAKMIALASAKGINVPRVLMIKKYQICMSRISGKNLSTLVNNKTKFNKKRTFMLAGRNLARLHILDIAHGDYTTANLMIDHSSDLFVIDFGLSEITNSVESKALDLLLMKRAIDKDAYRHFIVGYSGYKKAKEVMKRLNEIERRGRYQTRTLIANANEKSE